MVTFRQRPCNVMETKYKGKKRPCRDLPGGSNGHQGCLGGWGGSHFCGGRKRLGDEARW